MEPTRGAETARTQPAQEIRLRDLAPEVRTLRFFVKVITPEGKTTWADNNGAGYTLALP